MSASSSPVAESAAHPVLTSGRFRFRPFVFWDIEQLASLANQHRIADNTVGIPYPYTTESPACGSPHIPPNGSTIGRCIGAALGVGDRDDRHILGYAGLPKACRSWVFLWPMTPRRSGE
jgi:hypothetical protein